MLNLMLHHVTSRFEKVKLEVGLKKEKLMRVTLFLSELADFVF